MARGPSRGRGRGGGDQSPHQEAAASGVTQSNAPRTRDEADRLPLHRQSSSESGPHRRYMGAARTVGATLRVLLFFTVAFAVVVYVVVPLFLEKVAVRWQSFTETGEMMAWSQNARDGDDAARGKGPRDGRVLRFVPGDLLRRFKVQRGLDKIRWESRFGTRPPRLGVVLGDMRKDPTSILLFTVVKSLEERGYNLTIFAVKNGEAHPYWEQLGGRISMLGHDENIDWSIFEGIILSSLEAKIAISSLMQEPFHSVPLIWIIQEDTLGERLSLYTEMGWQHLIAMWRKAFSRADVVVFPDFSLPLLYTALDTGNFFVVPGSPVDVWAAESYQESHVKLQLREDNGFGEGDLVIVVIGGCLMYDHVPWGYADAVRLLGSQLIEFLKTRKLGKSFKLILLSGNSTDGPDGVLQDITLHLGLPDGFVKHYGLDGDVNEVLLMADIVLYGSFLDEQNFPLLLTRAMTFGIPIIAPDLAIIRKFVTNGLDCFIFQPDDPESLNLTLSLAIRELNLGELEWSTAGYRQLRMNIFAWDCVFGYAKLLENVIQFPSDTILPIFRPLVHRRTWEWSLLKEETENKRNETHRHFSTEYGSLTQASSIVYILEEELSERGMAENDSMNQNKTLILENPSELDWDGVREIELTEDIERREMQELVERTEQTLGSWEDIYAKSRQMLKMKFEDNERDEGQLGQIGQHVCIYEIYSGAGAWPFLHSGTLYRGLSLSKEAQGSRADDVVAIQRLPLLNNTYYRDLLCEYGGMLAIANKVDDIHKPPWIGFQSWRATGRKVSLSVTAEKVLDETLRAETRGDVFYFWAKANSESMDTRNNISLDFWSMCDILNNGHCRDIFEDALRLMYALPRDAPVLPPMPASGYWSALHSWVMPTPSFLEFVMFSRIFVDSLDSLNNSTIISNSCLLGSSQLEKRHCYCRVLELLVNVWAYHSARKMVYLHPESGVLREQHPLGQRVGLMQVKFFNFTLLKSMDEDLAESVADKFYPRQRWLWPFAGEIHCQLIMEWEREEMYRQKEAEHRKDLQNQLHRRIHGRSQKPLG